MGKRVDVLSNYTGSGSQIDISVDQLLQAPVAEDWLRMVMEKALAVAVEAEQERWQVSLFLTDDATIQELNDSYRGLNEVTDVLSFSTTHPGHWEGDDIPDGSPLPTEAAWEAFSLPPGEPSPLGEVVVSYPQVCRQATLFDRTISQELALMIVHGVLHLVGHDHLKPGEQAAMQAREQLALAEIFPKERD